MRALLAALLLGFATTAAAQAPAAVTPDGGRYFGPLAAGKLHGKGRIEWPNGAWYEGDFAQGVIHGRGKYYYANGGVYEGELKNGMMSGRGRFEWPEREVYEGEFRDDHYWGRGEIRYSDGRIYRGEFVRGEYEGKGRLDTRQGESWEGEFRKGEIVRGVYTARNGYRYEGKFVNWRPETPPAPARVDTERDRSRVRANVETALYAQKDLLDKAIAGLRPREPGRINLWLLAIGGDGSQEVFRREVEYVQRDFAQRFGTAGRSLALVNSRNTVATLPMATVSSVRIALNALAQRMDREEDILFLFMTSHGSREHEFMLSQNGMELQGLRAGVLGQLLKESGIKWKVVVVSACYSGGFIDHVQDGRTLVMTAARRDRTSFGCADENDFTYFGRAYFKESLPAARSFHDAFRKAEALVAEWEKKDIAGAAAANARAKRGADEGQSLPQISTTAAIDGQLGRWWAQIAR